MSHELYKYLDQDSDYQRTVENVRAAARRLWAAPVDRYAVDHGPDHADRVVGLLGGLTEGLMQRAEFALARAEITILLAAAYLHASGLQDEQSAPDADERWDRYPELGAELIYRVLESPEEAVDVGLADTDPSLVELTALVVAGHRQTEFPAPDYDAFLMGSVTVRPRLLTALLHLAAALDLDYRRVDLAQLKLLNPTPKQALNWWLHYYVSGVQVEDEYVHIGYRIPRDAPDYEATLPELVAYALRDEFAVLRDTFRLYGVKVDIAPPTAVRPMRAVKPMPDAVWAAAERRLAALQGAGPEPTALPKLVATVRGLLDAMGYTCGEPACDPDQALPPLLCFRCRPQSSGLRPPLWVGCKVGGPLAAPDVQTLLVQLAKAEQGYLVAETRVLASARKAAAATEGRVRVFTLNTFYRELLDFRAYVQGLVDAYEASELARIYVDLGAVRYTYDEQGKVVGEDQAKPLDDYVDAWLKEQGEGRNHISILGDYGTGKTSFCRQYAAKQARRWLVDPERARLPLLITLRDYTKTLEVKSLITNALVNAYGIQGATFAAFERFNADGKLLLIFDGFDEMAQRTGTRTAVENFWELARVVVPGSKVLLTSRTHYFRTHHETEALLHGRAWEPKANPRNQAAAVSDPSSSVPDYIDLRDRPNFEVLHLEPFTAADIQAVLRKRFPTQWQAYWKQLQAIYNLPDLAQRPVLLEMIMETLPQLQVGQTVNVAQLYQAYTAQWLERDVGQGRVLLTSAQRRTFAEELALTMFHSGAPSVHFSRLAKRVAAHFGLEEAEEIDHFAADVRTCNFLNRDAEGDYSFAHKSFMEFFVASRLHRLMLADQATVNGPVKITAEIRLFIHNLFALAPKTEPAPPHDPPAGCVWVPPGEFILGGPDGFDVQIARLETGVFIGKHPVTNAAYARFVNATNHEPPQHWKGPRPPSEIADHPVLYVTWRAAVAYTEWAGQRLPTEEEWEKAARGVDGRVYPWGDTWDAARCNTSKKGPTRTTPVEAYSPAGDSPCRAADMVGNVWEWTASPAQLEEEGRRRRVLSGSFPFPILHSRHFPQASEEGGRLVLRGGAFYNSSGYVRCACRINDDSYNRLRAIGFRVVVSPLRP